MTLLATSGDVIKFWDTKSFELKQVVPGAEGKLPD